MLDYAVILAGALLAGFAQGLSGVAIGMMAMALWAWAIPVQIAAQLAVLGALNGQTETIPANDAAI
jgi:hypothetical protein